MFPTKSNFISHKVSSYEEINLNYHIKMNEGEKNKPGAQLPGLKTDEDYLSISKDLSKTTILKLRYKLN